MITMMAQNKKHFLHELLSEDQEPFLLDNYISEKQNQINKKRPTVNNHCPQTNITTLQLKKQKPIQQQKQHSSTFFPINLCKSACFNTNTQDITKSPLFRLSQQHNNNYSSKSPCGSPNTIFLHVPARTASILLEAALRIQKHSKAKTHYYKNNNTTFGILGSLFKRLTQSSRKNNKKKQIEGQKETNYSNNNNSNVKKVKDILRFEFDACSVGRRRKEEENNNAQSHGACFVDADDDGNGFFCDSPFRFVLQRSLSSPSSGHRTPEFSSPAASPCRRRTEDKESNNGADGINKFQSRKDKEEEQEEKDQCSPVSVLDPPFEDDDDAHENDYEEGDFDLECSYANVQRTKQQLLYRLRRFEKLAELDPLELEKRMLDQEDNEYGTSTEEEGCEDDKSSETYNEENKDLRELVYAILCQSSICDREQVSEDLKRLVSDLIIEEEIRELNSSEDKDIVTRVCRRLELWKEVDSNTIDMMVDEDFSREEGGWKRNAQNVRMLAGELELAIFSSLVEEFSEELRC